MFKFSSGSCGSGKLFGKANGAGAPTARPSYVKDVVGKLKTLPDFAELREDELTGRAEELTDPQKLWSVHLSGLVLDPARDRIGRTLSEESVVGEAPGEVGIKLKFVPVRASGYYQYGASPLTSLLLEQYGPIRAFILVGGAVQLEWNTSGLVIPVGAPIPVPQSARNSSKCTSVSNSKSIANAASSGAVGSGVHVEASATSTAEEVISYEFESASAGKEKLDKLIDIVVRYNRNYLYHPISRNCQKFAADCMVALGYPIHPKLVGKLGDYFMQVKKKRKRKIDFVSHEDLDKHIREFLDSNAGVPEDAEYLLVQYFLFHVTSLTESDHPGRWVCQVPGCQKAQLELQVDLKTTVAYQMFRSN